MDVSLLELWMSQIIDNIPILIISTIFLGSIFVIAYKIISAQNKMIVDYIKQAEQRQEQEVKDREKFREDVYQQIGKTLDIYEDVKNALPAIKSFTEKYPKIEGVINSLEQNKHSYYDFLESIISRAKYSFKANYKNGSERSTSEIIIDKSYEHVLQTITAEEDLFHKEYHVAFADFCMYESRLLADELDKLSDVSIKLSVIESFFTNLRNILYHFRINLGDTYLKLKPKEVIEELKERFEGFKVKVDGKNKEVKETKGIFGF